MENSSSAVEFAPKDETKRKFIVSSDIYNEGRLYASQNWVTKGDIKRAAEYIIGISNSYGKQVPMGYVFTDAEGRDCLLVGDGHHRVATALAEGQELPVEIDGRVVVTSEMLKSPNKAAQKLAVIGIDGVWPFREFMKEFIEVRVNMNGSKGK